MTTYVLFVPPADAPFTFQLLLDGDTYTATITWNAFGQRWYINIYQLAGDLVICLPLIESPVGFDISITGGYFTSTLIYRDTTRFFEISP